VSDRFVMAAAVLAGATLVAPWGCTARARLAGRGPAARAGMWSGRAGAVLPVSLGVAVGLLTTVVVGGASGAVAGAVIGVVAALVARRVVRPADGASPAGPMRVAGAWDLLAASLRCGLPVATAVRAVAGHVPGAEGCVLRRVGELLALGADPAAAWRSALGHTATASLATAAIRTARSGAAMADAISELADGLRAAAADQTEARAQRAGVLITGPLGLCFLPAFFCVGVLPVVIGLAGQLLHNW
jgi:Flp pilus assembly protein TadB